MKVAVPKKKRGCVGARARGCVGVWVRGMCVLIRVRVCD